MAPPVLLYCLQYMHPECSAHEGYALVPPVVSELRGLQALRLTANSGQNVDLTPAAGVPDVSLVLTLAHYETTPFNRWAGQAALDGVTLLCWLARCPGGGRQLHPRAGQARPVHTAHISAVSMHAHTAACARVCPAGCPAAWARSQA